MRKIRLLKSSKLSCLLVLILIVNLSHPVLGSEGPSCNGICASVVSGVTDADWFFNTNGIKLRCETAGQLGEQCLAYEQVYSGEMWNTIVLALTAAAAATCVSACALQLAGNPLGEAVGAKCESLAFTEMASEAAATVALHWNNLFLGQGSGKDIAAAWLNVGAFAVGAGLRGMTKISGIGSGFEGLEEAGDGIADIGGVIDGQNTAKEDGAEAQARDQGDRVKSDMTQKSQIGLGEGVTGGAALTGFVASKSVGLYRKIQVKKGNIFPHEADESKEKQEKAETCMAAGIFTTMLGFRVAEQAILPKLKSDFCDVIKSLGPQDGSPMVDPCVDAAPTSSPTANPISTSRSMEMIYRSHSLQARVAELPLRLWLDRLSQSLWINQALGGPKADNKTSGPPNVAQLFQSCQNEGIGSCRLLNSPALKGTLVTFPKGQDFSAIVSVASDLSTQLSMTPRPRASDLLRYSLRNQSLPDRPQLPIEGIFAFADLVQDNAASLKKEIESKVQHSMFNVTGFQDRQWNSNREPAAMPSQTTAIKVQPASNSDNLPALHPVVLTALNAAETDIYHTTTTLNLFQIISLRISFTTKKWTGSQNRSSGFLGRSQ